MTIEIADRLVKLRKKYGYSQEELADKLGLSRQAVSKWERAEASPDTDNLICLAKLYGVSLDELLATDEDVDTIVKEQVKEEKKEDNSSETTVEKGRDRVVINDDGIFVQDKKGKKVTINDDGVTCYDQDGKIVKKVGKKPDKAMAVIGAIEGVLFLLVITAYLLLGILLNMWQSAWCLVFVPEIICSTARAIRKKNAQQFNVTFLACFAFFFVCMVLPDPALGILPEDTLLWNPMWVVFLLIPIYHSIVGVIHKIMGKEEKCCAQEPEEPKVKDLDEDDDDYDDDDDDNDCDDDEIVIERK